MIVTLELLLQIDKIAVHSVEPPRQEATEVETDRGIRLEQGHRILDHSETAEFDGSDLGGMGHTEKSREVAEDGTRLIGSRHRNTALGDFDDTLGEKIEQAGGGSLGDHRFPRLETMERLVLEEIEW